MTLYKYVVADRIDVLQRGLIRFTPPSALNDPWELKPYIESLMTDELWETEARAKALEHFKPEEVVAKAVEDAAKNIWSGWNRQQKRATPFSKLYAVLLAQVRANPELIKSLYLANYNTLIDAAIAKQKDFIRIAYDVLDKSIGILSLSERPDHHLMWSHYANTHAGFVIAFDEAHPFFTTRRSDEDSVNGLRQVTYSRERPSMKALIDFDPMHEEKFATKLFFTKGEDWKYEQEWRLVKHFKEADVIEEKPFGTLHLFKLPPSCVEGIIFGFKMEQGRREELQNLVRQDDRYTHVNLSQALMSEASYDMEVRPIF